MPKPMFEEGKGVSLADLKEPQEVIPPTQDGNVEPGQAPVGQPPAEPAAATPQEPPAKPAPTAEPPKTVEQAIPATPPAPEQQPQNLAFIDNLNKILGQEFKSEDQVKEVFNRPTMESEYSEMKGKHEASVKELDDLRTKYDVMTETLNPRSYFSSDEAMKLELFKKENPGKDASVAQTVFSTDLDKVDDIKVVTMGWKFNNPNLPGNDGDIETAIKEKLGVDPETPLSEMPTSAKIQLGVLAGEFKDQFKTVKDSVKLPDIPNVEDIISQRQQTAETAKTQLTEDWTKNAESVLSNTSQLKVPIGEPKEGEEQEFFEWDLGSPPKEDIDSIKDDFISLGMEFTDDTKETFQSALRMRLQDKYLPKMLQKYGEDLLARQKEVHLQETNNTAPLTDARPEEPSSKEKEIKERSDFARDGLGYNSPGRPLFNFPK